MNPYTVGEAARIAATIVAHSGDDEELECALDPARASEACGMFDDREARCGWQRDAFADAFKIIAHRTGWAAFIAAHPAIQTDVSTGGGCMVWTLDHPSGEQLMFTSGTDGGYQPCPADDTVTVGYYDARGEWDEVNRPEYTWSELTAFVAGFLAGKVSP